MPRTKCPHCRLRIRTTDPPLRCLARGFGHFELVGLSEDRKRKLEQTVIWAESRQISVRGELDCAGVDALGRLLADLIGSGLPCVVLELSSCEFLDAGAPGAIVGLERRLAANGQELVVDGATGRVERLIASARAISPRVSRRAEVGST